MQFTARPGETASRAGGSGLSWSQGVLAIAALLLLMGNPSMAWAQSPSDTTSDPRKEYNVKGAFLYSIGRYASWPASVFASEQAPFVIGVLGESPILTVLQHIQQSKKINNRPIEVRTITEQQEIERCQMLFLAHTLDAEMQRSVIQRHSQSHVLLIGETPGFAHWGGVINFYLADGSVRFEINIDAARRREISVDAKLLRIATLVTDAGATTATDAALK